jgi:hypothetical protein
MVPEQFDSHGELRRYETLLHLADVVVHHRGLDELFRELAEHLREFAAFELATFSLHDSSKNVMRVHLWEEPGLLPTIAELPVEGSAAGRAWQNQQPFVVPGQDVESIYRLHAGERRRRASGLIARCP